MPDFDMKRVQQVYTKIIQMAEAGLTPFEDERMVVDTYNVVLKTDEDREKWQRVFEAFGPDNVAVFRQGKWVDYLLKLSIKKPSGKPKVADNPTVENPHTAPIDDDHLFGN